VKLLLDQGLPRTAATELATLGWDVVHVGEIGMAAAKDVGPLPLVRSAGGVRGRHPRVSTRAGGASWPTKTGVSFTWEGAWEFDQAKHMAEARRAAMPAHRRAFAKQGRRCR
jgi:hypothetical protein